MCQRGRILNLKLWEPISAIPLPTSVVPCVPSQSFSFLPTRLPWKWVGYPSKSNRNCTWHWTATQCLLICPNTLVGSKMLASTGSTSKLLPTAAEGIKYSMFILVMWKRILTGQKPKIYSQKLYSELNYQMGLGETAQQLGTFAVLSDSPTWFPAPTEQLKVMSSQFLGDPTHSPALCRHCIDMVHLCTCRQKPKHTHTHVKKKN